MSESPSTNRTGLEEAKRLLALNPMLRTACELDLLVFMYRHPRALLTNEQLAAFVGYGMKQVAKATDAFIAAGVLERTQNPKHAARMYLLVLDGPLGSGPQALLDLASTRQGRTDILKLLEPGSFNVLPDVTPEMSKSHAII